MAEEKKQVQPNEVETKETRKETLAEADQPFDSSQAQSTRKDEGREQSFDRDPDEKDRKENGDEDFPQLTGDEETVTKEEGSHEYPDQKNTGPIQSSDE